MEADHIGVDWSSGSWLAVGYRDCQTTEVGLFDDIEELRADLDHPERVVVDTPIGLCESLEKDEIRGEVTNGELSRKCDELARKVIGPRSSSVFTAPSREAAKMAAKGEPYADVNETNNDLTGKGLMQQTNHISGGIVAVERLLLDGEGDPEILVEGHPEVCFRAFNGNPLQHSKKNAPGVEERLQALENADEYEEGQWRDVMTALLEKGHEVGVDDVLDAMVLALTACATEEEYQTLPLNPPVDHEGLPMQMVYRASEPFPAISTSN